MQIFEIHFFCPTHQRDIVTGINVDGVTFLRTKLSAVRVICPHCEQIHMFLMANSHNELLRPNDVLSVAAA